ncbi:MAG: peroxiredoxin family protein [Planctomycetota bacterium]|jgi:hypothetical protein
MKLYDERKDARHRFEILAFHDATVQSLKEMDEKLARIVATKWNGKTLPFPVLLDASGETIRKLEIRSFPTVVLIDPEGRVVKNGSETMLAEKLAARD